MTWLTLILALVAGASAAVVADQGSGAAETTCRTLVTDEDVTRAAGQAMQLNTQATEAGHSACTWIGAPPGRLTVLVRDPRQASPPQTLDGAFDAAVADARGMFDTHEPLEGVGQRAVYFPGDPDMQILFVQRADAIVVINAAGVGRESLIALARIAGSR